MATRHSGPASWALRRHARSGLNALALDDGDDAVNAEDGDFFDGAAGPVDFELIDLG